MDKNEKSNLGAILLALHDRNRGINESIGTINADVRGTNMHDRPGRWLLALARAQAELEATSELIQKIIDVNKDKVGFDPERWS